MVAYLFRREYRFLRIDIIQLKSKRMNRDKTIFSIYFSYLPSKLISKYN